MITKALLFLLLPVLCSGQGRFTSGELKGFTRSPHEHIIDRLDDPFTVRCISGTVVFESDGRPMKGVLVEVRGPGDGTTVVGTRTNGSGQFSMARLKDGTYTFKATLDGYQSILGQVAISKIAPPTERIRLRLKPGV
jgi:hypothetical protein